jgi:Glycosyl hydrolases family 2, sugar binding domain
LMQRLEASLSKAERLAQTEPDKTHVRLERLMFDHVRDYVAMEAAKRECHFGEGASLADRLISNQQRLHAISPFLGYEPYAVYGPDWEAKRLRSLSARMDGTEGSLVAVLPAEARGQKDPFDDGRYERWQAADYDESNWKPLATTQGWENQGWLDPKGHAYRGLAWYRMHVDVPATATGKRTYLFAPAVVNEAWVWVNGRYAGHRPYQSSWSRPQSLELEIGSLLRPGENQITFRVLNNMDVFGASGIYERVFLYSKS